MTLRKILILLSLLTLLGASGCGDDDKKEKVVEFPAELLITDTTANPANRILVAIVAVDEAGWVVLQADSGGAPGDVIGQTLVERGDHTNIEVTLTRDATDGEMLHATLHYDRGTEGAFDGGGVDPVAEDEEGAEVTRGFVVTVPMADVPYVVVEDQEPDTPDSENQPNAATLIEIKEVFITGPGWISIRSDGGGSPAAEVLGATFVPDGLSRGVDLVLNRDAVDGETLYAVLHSETGMIGTFDFPGADPELMAGGGLVVDSFIAGVEPAVFIPRVSANDQTAMPANQVIVAEVSHDRDGWVVIFSGNGEDLGHTAIAGGTSNDLSITLSRDAMEAEVLTAALHDDLGSAGTYEVPDVDTATTNPENGNNIRSDFTVSLSAPTPSISVADQTLSGFTSVVDVTDVTAPAAGWVAIYDDNAGAPGAVLGSYAVTLGGNGGAQVQLSRRVTDGETLWAQLHSDGANPGAFDAAEDPVVEVDTTPVRGSFVATLGAGAVDLRISIGAMDSTAYQISGVEPAAIDNGAAGGGNNPGLTLTTGWRYEVVNAAAGSHPFELTTANADPTMDTILLSESAAGSMEADAEINWTDDGSGTVAFTVSSGLAAALTGYRCSSHFMAMRGAVTTQ